MSEHRKKEVRSKLSSRSHKSGRESKREHVRVKDERKSENEDRSSSSSASSSDGSNSDDSDSSSPVPVVRKNREAKESKRQTLKVKQEPLSPETGKSTRSRESVSPKRIHSSSSGKDRDDRKRHRSSKDEDIEPKRSATKSHHNRDRTYSSRSDRGDNHHEHKSDKYRRDRDYDHRERKRDDRRELSHSSRDRSHGNQRSERDSLDRRRHDHSPNDRKHRRRSPDSDNERPNNDQYSKSRDKQRERKQRKLREQKEDLNDYQFGGKGALSSDKDSKEEEEAVDKEKPNFELSGKLTEFTNTYKGVVIIYNEPPEARKPKARWRLYPFKGEESLPVMYVHRQSAFLIGRDRKVADIPVDHPSCSKQHAALQYRLVNHKRDDGVMTRKVKPYIIDLDAPNGTYVNNQRIDARRYYELKEQDVLKFGFSTREYVILHEKSEDDPPSENETEEKD